MNVILKVMTERERNELLANIEENIHNTMIATLLKHSNSEEWSARLPEIHCLQLSVLTKLTNFFRYFQILNRKNFPSNSAPVYIKFLSELFKPIH